jgi:GDPmannose 4,6-dehydratase
MPLALVTGITGQDGSYLAELLLARGYAVHGWVRDPARAAAAPHLAAIAPRLAFHAARWDDSTEVASLVHRLAPDEIYHLAAQTHVAGSYADPVGTAEFNGIGTLRLLEACRTAPRPPRLFHASSCQIFGKPETEPQDESTPSRPLNSYGASKAHATDLVRIYRESHRLFAVNGICYNHESPRRGPEFVTGKICRAAAAIARGDGAPLKLGDIKAERDWGDAREFVDGFHRSLQAAAADDYVFATGTLHTVEDVLDAAFGAVGLEWRRHVEFDPALLRPAEARRLVGNPARAAARLGWTPRRPLRSLIREMVEKQLATMPAA